MDTNMAQAIKLAGGILIAMVLISALVYFFSAISPLQTQLDDIKALEQTTDFNKEFEVYQKDIMYGLDVISVLNKAASYNKVYIDEYGYSEDLKNNYLIDIVFEEEIELVQTLEIYKIKYETNPITGQTNYREIPIDWTSEASAIESDICSKLIINDTEYEKESEDSLIGNLILDNNEYNNRKNNYNGNITLKEKIEKYKNVNPDIYAKIIDVSSTKMKKTITNTVNPQDWSRAVLETYAYNFKTKKFRCTGINYSELTGRVVSLTFTEIK